MKLNATMLDPAGFQFNAVLPSRAASWTPPIEQNACKSAPGSIFETTDLVGNNFGFSAPESPHLPLRASQPDVDHAYHSGRQRPTSSPLTSVTRQDRLALHSHSHTISFKASQGGLDKPVYCKASMDEKATTAAAASSPSDALPPTYIKEEEGMSDDAVDSPPSTTKEVGKEKEQPLTAAEMRAEKRKMTRFRLNHQQTRYLMSEFARQAHPDASQRVRLSRAIPGLSSRQVQVWFQNRRAKLKNVTQVDRDKIVHSRALPENFDLSSALVTPFSPRPSYSARSSTQDGFPSSPLDYEAWPFASSMSPQSQPQCDALASYLCTRSTTLDDSRSFDQDICNLFSPTLPFGLEVTTAEARDLESSEQSSSSSYIGVSSEYLPYTPQSSLFAPPLNASFHVSDPEVSPYGLGFTYDSVPEFQAASVQTGRNPARLPDRVRIPRKNQAACGTTLYTPIYSSMTCSPVGTPLGFPVLSAPASVTSFPSYIQ